jgi:hypothetical protein
MTTIVAFQQSTSGDVDIKLGKDYFFQVDLIEAESSKYNYISSRDLKIYDKLLLPISIIDNIKHLKNFMNNYLKPNQSKYVTARVVGNYPHFKVDNLKMYLANMDEVWNMYPEVIVSKTLHHIILNEPFAPPPATVRKIADEYQERVRKLIAFGEHHELKHREFQEQEERERAKEKERQDFDPVKFERMMEEWQKEMGCDQKGLI